MMSITKISINIQIYKVPKRTMMLLRSNIYKNFIKTSLLNKNHNLIIIKTQTHENRLLIFENKKAEYIFGITKSIANYTNIPQKTLLLTTNQNKKYISGLMSISTQEYSMLRGHDIDSKHYQGVVKFTLAKILYVLYGMDQKICLKLKFELIFSTTGLDLNNMPKLLPLKKYTTLLQSILTYICYDTALTFDMLKDFSFPLDCESYRGKNITILTFMEAFIAKKNLHHNFIDRTHTKHYLVNPENLQAIPGFSNMESMVQTKQRNCDLYIRTIFKKQILDTYMDVKTFSVSGFFQKNLLSVTFLTQKEFLKEYNNIKTTLQAFFNTLTNNVLKNNLSTLMLDLEQVKSSGYSIQHKASTMHKLLLDFKLDPENKEISISLNIMLNPQTTTEFALFLDELMQKIQHNNIANIETIFPINYQISLEERQEFLKYFVKDIFQNDSPLAEIMIANMRALSFITKT